MGYESKIYIVRKSNHMRCDETNLRYAEVIAMVDVGKCYQISDILRRKPKTDCYIYESDGNTQILEDRYGEPLTETTVADAINIVASAMKRDDFWRYDILLGLLNSVAKYTSENSNIVVLHFGH